MRINEELTYIKEVEGGVDISILALPRSSKSEIVGLLGGLLKVKIASPPVDGAANDALIKFFAKIFRISKSDVSIVKGERAKRKKVRLSGIDIKGAIDIIKLHV